MAAQIPTFNLYGEKQEWPTPDLLHWESVAQRSRLHNWTIRPHRHTSLLQLIYVQRGGVTVHLDGDTQSPSPSCLLLLPPLCVHGFNFSSDVEGHVLTLAAPLLEQLSFQLGAKNWLLHRGRIFPDANEELAEIFESLAAEYLGQRPHREWALQTAVNRLILWLARSEVELPQQAAQQPGKSQQHLARFNQLVEQRFREHQPLSFYAGELRISPPHLNSICRQLANRSALQLIHERLLLEAKRNLVYTAMTISEIAISLGFSEPAYFTRFFKKLTGVSPQEFRRGRWDVRCEM